MSGFGGLVREWRMIREKRNDGMAGWPGDVGGGWSSGVGASGNGSEVDAAGLRGGGAVDGRDGGVQARKIDLTGQAEHADVLDDLTAGDEKKCGARAVFWPDDEGCEAVCMLDVGPAGKHFEHWDEILGEWDERELTTWWSE